MDKRQKQAHIALLEQVLEENSTIVMARNRGLNVAAMEDLRAKARENGCGVKVIKNTLARLVLDKKDFPDCKQILKGPCVFVYSADLSASARLARDFAKDNKKFELLAALLEGELLDPGRIEALANMPTLEGARAMLASAIQGPMVALARQLVEPGVRVARLLDARAKQQS